MFDGMKEGVNDFLMTAMKWVAGIAAVGFIGKMIFGKKSSPSQGAGQDVPAMRQEHLLPAPPATPRVERDAGVQR